MKDWGGAQPAPREVAVGRERRGSDPEDERAFGPGQLAPLRAATADLSWLLGRGYALVAATKLVGDHFQLTARQRAAITRCAAPDPSVVSRASRRLPSARLERVAVDGFNVLVTLERALGGGVVLIGRDGVCRDLAGVHGTWRAVADTEQALALVGEALAGAQVVWWLDRPVSNSGRLAAMARSLAAERGWAWEVSVVDSPDAELVASAWPVATADAGILDRCGPWVNLVRELVDARIPEARLVDLGCGPVG